MAAREVAVHRTMAAREVAVHRTMAAREVAVHRTMAAREVAVHRTMAAREVAAARSFLAMSTPCIPKLQCISCVVKTFASLFIHPSIHSPIDPSVHCIKPYYPFRSGV